MNTSIKGKKSDGERDPLEEKNPGKGEKEVYNAPRTLFEDLDPTTHTNERLS